MLNICNKAVVVLALLLCRNICSSEMKVGNNTFLGETEFNKFEKTPLEIGRLSENWTKDGASIILGKASQTLYRPGNWEGTTDSSAAIHLAWDKEYLYFHADVVDNKLMQAASTGAEPWQGDSFELFFNVQPRKQRTPCFRQISIVPALKPDRTVDVICPQGDFSVEKSKTVVYERGYSIECRIPWSNFNDFIPEDGAWLGFQVMLDDRDGRGRKSQLCWYPSAVTYVHPIETGMLILSKKPGSSSYKSFVGPNTMCVTDPTKMKFSFISIDTNIVSAEISVLEEKSSLEYITAGLQHFPLYTMNDAVVFGNGSFDISGISGETLFNVAFYDSTSNVIKTIYFEKYLIGEEYNSMRIHLKELEKKLDELSADNNSDVYAKEVSGVKFWLQRLNALYWNEARPERVDADLFNRMSKELTNVEKAVEELAQGKNPYKSKRGSFVKAYRSPLTGNFRGHALYIPDSYDRSKPMPMIILLHGIFGDERHLFQMLDDVENLDAIVYQAASYRQFDWSDVSAAETWTGLEQVMKDYNIDLQRIYLVGYHIGGRGTLQLAMDRPGFFAALGAMYPGIDTRPHYPAMQLYPEYYEKATDNLKPFPHYRKPDMPEPLQDDTLKKVYERLSLVTRVDNIAGVPMVFVFGESDPDAAAERLALMDKLVELSPDISVEYVPGAQHGSKPSQLSDPEFYKWLLANKKTEMPKKFKFTVTVLRNNKGWFSQVDSLVSSLEPGSVGFSHKFDNVFEFKTSGVDAFTPIADADVLKGQKVKVIVDGVVFDNVSEEDIPLSLIKSKSGDWKRGLVKSKYKRYGLSGPINDFQFDRFLYVYGTQGSDEENAAVKKAAEKLANRGLGAVFNIKADKDVTQKDIEESNLVLVGTPNNNSILKKVKSKLPMKWVEDGLLIGNNVVKGKAAGCMIYPNPLMPNRYVVVITSEDPTLYRSIWKKRYGVDYVICSFSEDDKKFEDVHMGCFEDDWSL